VANLNIKTALTGGTVNCVDRNSAGMKIDGSVCFALIVGSPNTLRAYKYSASSTATANGDAVIIPYGQSGGTSGRWLLYGIKYLADPVVQGNLTFDSAADGIVFGDGSQMRPSATHGLWIYQGDDSKPPVVRNAANTATLLALSPATSAEHIAGTADNKPATPAGVAAAVGAANSPFVKSALNASGEAPIFAPRAWVSFNGSGTVAILGAGNVTSITDRGVGLYTANLAVALPDTNAAAIAGCRGDGGEADRCPTSYIASTSQVFICTANSGASKQDVGYVTLIITA